MSRKPIISKTIAEQTATELDIRIINMPLYPAFASVTNIFYAYYKADGKRIEDESAEGNYILGDIISEDSKNALLTALTNLVGTVTKADLEFYQLDGNKYTIRYTKDGKPDTVIIKGSYFTLNEIDSVKASVLTLTSDIPTDWAARKSLTVTSSSVQIDYPVYITLHNTTGTDSVTDLYLNNVRTDWGDVRIEYNGSVIPYAVIKKDATSILVSFTASLQSGDNLFIVKFNRPALNTPYKIACLTDTHYDPNDPSEDRPQTLNFIDNFVARMATYQPDLAVNNGDKVGGSITNISGESTRLAYYQANIDHFAAVSAHATVVRDGVAMGNHDCEAFNWTNVKAKHSGETWMQPGVMYGYWESADFRFISLDGNYDPATQLHNNNLNTWYAYIDNTQMAWLQATLAASTKPCIIFIHHACCEIETSIILLTKEVYHLSNRVALRAILEASGKVACVIHGHLHWHRHDIINGIPYLIMTNSATEEQPLSNPTNTDGRWYLIEIDKDACKIKFTLEAKIGTGYVTIYEDVVSYKTIFNDDIGDSAERVYALNWSANYSKASLLSDPAQLYVTNKDYIAFMPVNKYLNEPYISDRTIKIVGRSTTIGKGSFYFATQTALFRMKFGFYASQLQTLNFKLGNGSNADTAPSIVLNFVSDGTIAAYNGASGSSISTHVVNTWYQFEIIVNTASSTFTIKKDGTAIATNYAFKGANTQLNQMQIETQTGSWFIDNLRVEHYTTPEPTITV